ncbi:hypothetical protein WA026_009843 [Henosepilachna vigintioctopunctata]|uniref:Uncharacterized protein n=1 Tax=Henosepilachna vigintioctopunctata TaxID=420089 RepID=A0AAW1TS49_9CUCU
MGNATADHLDRNPYSQASKLLLETLDCPVILLDRRRPEVLKPTETMLLKKNDQIVIRSKKGLLSMTRTEMVLTFRKAAPR